MKTVKERHKKLDEISEGIKDSILCNGLSLYEAEYVLKKTQTELFEANSPKKEKAKESVLKRLLKSFFISR